MQSLQKNVNVRKHACVCLSFDAVQISWANQSLVLAAGQLTEEHAVAQSLQDAFAVKAC